MPRKNKSITSKHLYTLQTNIIAKNKYVEVLSNIVKFPDGHIGDYIYLKEPTGGAVAFVTNQKQEIYTHQIFRYAVNGTFWELPRGYGNNGELINQIATREFGEESGFEFELLSEPTLLGWVQPNSSILASRIPIYWLKVKIGFEGTPDSNELYTTRRWVSISKLMQEINDGNIEDAFTLSAVFLFIAKFKDYSIQ